MRAWKKAREVIDVTLAETTAALERDAAELAAARAEFAKRALVHAMAAVAVAPDPAQVRDGCGPRTMAAVKQAEAYRVQAREDAALAHQLDMLTAAVEKALECQKATR